MFSEDELTVSEIRFQATRLQELVQRIECYADFKDNMDFYMENIQQIEKALKKVRSRALETAGI
jgi:hypothetical protein